ncbi:hypothetical protein Alches_17510 [Alicyclobacillus hesperidum subsp. aegles]|uniref:Uncharacterized protein n=1 Tax=Alicyclobacillus tolerans TaxID=90970 RepID=A0A1M6LQQ3_9BACL|nr:MULTISPECIES: hypothetical protein [Alicyclobacillus]GLG01711.1 hypothetical protein Alches_17510 [Alicyclobacillus hesperidum subsp. aegles]SHJ73392.1 hypothetical protein SAMN05443507_10347 [Alicyclobacillus montanus]
MTKMEELNARVERVERSVFEHSLCPKKLDELLDMQGEISDIRESFLNQPFTGIAVEELEDLRFRILECEFNVHIFASEAMYQSTEESMRRLNDLYETVSDGGENQ